MAAVKNAGVKLAEESLQRACRVFEKQSKDIAGKIIDFIAQFEDELVRVWNKPKFVLNSHYIITLDKIIPSPPRASGGPG